MKQNNWATFDIDQIDLNWWADFPASILDRKGVLMMEFVKEFVNLGAKEGVLEFTKIGESSPMNGAQYIDFLNAKIQALLDSQWDVLHVFRTFSDLERQASQVGAIVSSRIYYYDDRGEIRSGRVSDAGKVFAAAAPEVARNTVVYETAPLNILGVADDFKQAYTTGVGVPSKSGLGISISLFTDLWFSRVSNWLRRYESDEFSEDHDNRELASLHTPALNRFLTAARHLTLEMGGKWRLFSSESEEYIAHHGITETGIILE